MKSTSDADNAASSGYQLSSSNAPTYSQLYATQHHKWRVGLGAMISISLHIAVAASLLWLGNDTNKKNNANAAQKTVSVVSLYLNPSPIFAVAKPAIVDSIGTLAIKEQNAAGPIASANATQAVSIASAPKNIRSEPMASLEGVETAPKLMGGVVIDDNLIPPNIPTLRAKIWIDEAGQATLVELLDDLKDADAAATIIAALMDALYIPAERGGKTVASIALMQFSRSEVEFSLPLTEQSGVVTPDDSSAK